MYLLSFMELCNQQVNIFFSPALFTKKILERWEVPQMPPPPLIRRWQYVISRILYLIPSPQLALHWLHSPTRKLNKQYVYYYLLMLHFNTFYIYIVFLLYTAFIQVHVMIILVVTLIVNIYILHT